MRAEAEATGVINLKTAATLPTPECECCSLYLVGFHAENRRRLGDGGWWFAALEVISHIPYLGSLSTAVKLACFAGLVCNLACTTRV
jgi:hypothetical protein